MKNEEQLKKQVKSLSIMVMGLGIMCLSLSIVNLCQIITFQRSPRVDEGALQQMKTRIEQLEKAVEEKLKQKAENETQVNKK